MPQVLIETRLNSLKLCESAQVRKGCLGRLEGICADFANPTRNGRFYSRELWERVFNDDLVKEALETKTLIGELDHPEERFETLAQEACVVMTDYKFNEDTLTGGFDILDTQKGRTLKALLDYGCIMGVSSRGQGDVESNGQYEEVDPATYDFAGFDVVLTPAVKRARQKVTESAKKAEIEKLVPLTESLTKEIDAVNSVEALDSITKLIEAAHLPNSADLMEAISNKRKSIEEGKTISERIKTDLHNVKAANRELERKVKTITAETIREKSKLNKTISEMTSKILAYQHREKRLSETLNAARRENVRLTRKVESAKEAAKTANKALKTESNRQKSNDSMIQRLKSKIASLTESIKSKDAELGSMQSKLDAAEIKISGLTEKLKSAKNQSTSLNESANREKTKMLNENARLSSELMTALNSYATVSSAKYGLTESAVKSIVKNCKSIADVDKSLKEAADKLDRYSKLPFTTDEAKPIVVENVNLKNNNTELDDEMKTTEEFISRAFGLTQ